MKTKIIVLALLLIAFAPLTASAEGSDSWKGKKSFGLTANGYYEINSDFSSLYFGNTTINSVKTAGFGFAGFIEYGFSDKLTGELSLGYSRLVWASTQRNIIKENYFTADVVGHFHFVNNDKVDFYGILGPGVYASSGAVAPVLNAGLGNHFKLNDELSIKLEAVYKSAVILNRLEGRVGLAYHF